jgi:hypothetical protein
MHTPEVEWPASASFRSSRLVRRGLATIAAVVLATTALAADNPWGKDINAGAGPALIESVRADLTVIVKAPKDQRGELIETFVASRGAPTIEAVKRFRNPELRPLFHALLGHEDWRVRHRALLALEHYRDKTALVGAWRLLSDAEPRLREQAAISYIVLWHGAAAKAAAGGAPAAAIADLRARETDPHVASCLDALALRARGKLKVTKVQEEHVETLQDGLQITPFISGLHETKTKAPGYTKKVTSQGGGKSAAKLDPSRPWTTPLIAMGTEVVSGTSLQPFANLRQNGKVYHTGLDVGASMDGSGYYAAADGFVRMIHAGSDMGTLMVVQHQGGQQVRSGQLLGTMGMSYSIENGGHYAHLHYGLYPGSFSETHNYGYRAVAVGLVDWYDPAHYLPVWAELTQPLVRPRPGGRPELAKARTKLGGGRLADAWKLAGGVAAQDGTADDVRAEAESLRGEIEAAITGATKRADRIRNLGYPSRAVAFLQSATKVSKGVTGADTLADAAKTWAKDETLGASIKAEMQLLKAEAKALGTTPSGDAARETRAAYEQLLAELGDTCLRPRIEALIRGTGIR